MIRKLLARATGEWELERALEELRNGRVTMRTAARKADLTYVEMLDRAEESEIQLEHTEEDLRDELAELEER